jgi:hypothetical protein
MKFNKFFVVFIVLISCSNLALAQRTFYFTEQWAISGGIGASTFYGDLTDKSNRFFANTPFSKYFYQDRQTRAAIMLEKKINIYFGLRGEISYGKIKSTQESAKQYFTANLFEYSLSATFDFTNMLMGADRFRLWSVYGTLGVGFTESRTWKYDMLSGDLIGTNGFGSPKRQGGNYVPMTETVLPLSLGFNYSFTREFSAFVEMSYHPIRTDKLDATLSEDSKRDSYGVMMIGARYIFKLPDHWQIGNRYPRYNGKSNDPAIKSYNKRRRVVMKTKGYNRGLKNKRRFKTTGRRKGLFRRR